MPNSTFEQVHASMYGNSSTGGANNRRSRRSKTRGERDPLAGIMSAKQLWDKEFPDPKWAVPGVIPEGVSILAGKPKLGKSWLAYHLAIAVAAGGVALGKHTVEQGKALYLALEDGERRLQKRLKKLIPEGEPPDHLDLVTEWPRLDKGGTDALKRWLEAQDDARLVVVDTLKKVRPADSGRRNIYDVDYEALEPLLPLARDYGVAMLVVHHLRQMDADDPLDTISGSTGLTGGVDGAMVLKRERGRADAFLYVTHRDLEDDLELALGWDQLTATWASMGNAEEYRLSQERAAVIKVLRDVPEGMGPKDIHEALVADGHTTTSQGALRRLLPKMVADGQLKNPRYGFYTSDASVTGTPRTPGNSGNTGNSPVTYRENSIVRGGNSGNTTGNTSRTVTDDKRGGNTLEPIVEPTVTADTAVTAERGNTDWLNHSISCECEKCLYEEI